MITVIAARSIAFSLGGQRSFISTGTVSAARAIASVLAAPRG
jgi:hypothetical protein